MDMIQATLAPSNTHYVSWWYSLHNIFNIHNWEENKDVQKTEKNYNLFLNV